MRKLFVIALMTVFPAASPASGPEATVENMVAAFQSGDGGGLVECLHPDVLAELDASLAGVRGNPEDAVELMAFMGVETTVEEIVSIDIAGFISLILKSRMFAEALTGTVLEVGAHRVSGDVATVEITINGSVTEVNLVKHEGRWVFSPNNDFDVQEIIR